MNDAWSLDDAATGRDPKYREIAILIDHSAAVRLWLDRSGTRPRVCIEDLDHGNQIVLTAAELAELIVDGPPRERHQAAGVGAVVVTPARPRLALSALTLSGCNHSPLRRTSRE